MEVTLRGFVEKEIDSLIVPEILEKLVMWFQTTYPIKSTEDSLFGFIVGAIFGRFATIIAITYHRFPNDGEFKEFMELLERRTMEIKSKIKLAMSK
jgi:hypothetical protein